MEKYETITKDLKELESEKVDKVIETLKSMTSNLEKIRDDLKIETLNFITVKTELKTAAANVNAEREKFEKTRKEMEKEIADLKMGKIRVRTRIPK